MKVDVKSVFSESIVIRIRKYTRTDPVTALCVDPLFHATPPNLLTSSEKEKGQSH